MSEKIQRWRVTNGYPTFHSNRDGEWCDATDVSVLESRLAEAEKALAEERGVSSTTIAGCIKFEEENRALSARIRELEGALGPLAELAEELSAERCEPEDECGLFKVVGDETLDRRLRASEIFRAARALKEEG